MAASLISALFGASASAHSQAAHGAIEGTVTDLTGGVLPGASVIVTNLDTGTERLSITNENGLYRVLLLPLGTYRVVAELPGFKRFEHAGVRIGAGQSVLVDMRLNVGDVTETVSVSAETQPVLNAAKIDLGRNLTAAEVRNLPLVSRNPFNFALVQPGISGFENAEFGVPRLAANGALMRVNYQIDGNTNTEKDRAGLRLLPMSEVMVGEVKVATAGYAPEFGQTMGLVYNAITPSGANQLRGDATYLFRRKSFSAFPFYFQGARTEERKPDTDVDTLAGSVGGPVVRDRLLYYVGYERTDRDLSAQRVVTITPDEAQALGIGPQPATIPARQAATFFIGKADYQLAAAHRLTVRAIVFRNDSPYNGSGGGLSSLQRATDFLDAMASTAAQVVTTLGSRQLNEFRLQYASREQSSSRNADSGSGPAIDVAGIRFGSPLFGAGQDNDRFRFRQGILQLTDNYTLLRSSHNYKVGVDVQWIRDERTSAPVEVYTFPTIAAYQAAATGADRFAYTQFTQLLGDRSFRMRTSVVGLFAQDDWQLTPDLKLLYGVRYDQYRVPAARRDSPFAFSQRFNRDNDNFGPRAGLAWRVDERWVMRASAGVVFDQPILAIYENALQLNGSPLARSMTLGPTSAGAPPFPGSLSDVPEGTAFPPSSLVTVDPGFEVARTWQGNLQVERSVATDYTLAIGYLFAKHAGLPVVTDINLINPSGRLSDGRPVFSAAVNSGSRMDPRFNHIYNVESIGEGRYDAVSVTLARRFVRGLTVNLSYTFGKGEDNAPINNAIPGGVGLAVNGDDPRSDPTNLDRDKGPNLLDVRHNFNGSVVYAPSIRSDHRLIEALANGNQLGILVQFNSGLPINVRANRDLNADGLSNNDRPLFVGRNSMYLPARYNVDLRYARLITVYGPVRAEVVGEFKNVFNVRQTAAVDAVVQVDAAGSPLVALPGGASGFRPTGGYEQRQFQLGFRIRF
jgi:hypothetical protein